MLRLCALLLAAVWLVVPAGAATSDATLRASLQRDLNQYLSARSKIEHISAISLSISLHGRPENINLTAGRTQNGGGTPVTPDNLWQIGSNTKAFTAATILQLEAEEKLTIDQTVGHWLPQYPAWKNVTIRRLLNLTSGIPTYNHVAAMMAAFGKNPKRNFTLAQLIIERASGHSYASELEHRFLQSDLGLNDTYYSGTQYPRDVLDRMVSGYFFERAPDEYGAAHLFGQDVRDNSVSWMQASGGIVSTPEDLTRWARALYTGPMLAPKQRAELFSLVSEKSGKPIAKTSLSDPKASDSAWSRSRSRRSGRSGGTRAKRSDIA
jgi:D-alanyl-D-alanine carboxypeptidase